MADHLSKRSRITPLKSTANEPLTNRTPRGDGKSIGVQLREPNTPHSTRALRAHREAVGSASQGRWRRRLAEPVKTPRDILRALSRELAPISKPVVASPWIPPSRSGKKSSMNTDGDGIGDGNHDDNEYSNFHEEPSPQPPPPSSPPEDMDMTAQSIELQRRVVGERQSRLSMASVRLSERFGGDAAALSGDDTAEVVYTGTIGPLVFGRRADNQLDGEITNKLDDDTTLELRELRASQHQSRLSDADQRRNLGLYDEPMFRFKMPGSRDPSPSLPQQQDEEETRQSEGEGDLNANVSDDEGLNESDAIEESANPLLGGDDDEEGEDDGYETGSNAAGDINLEESRRVSEPQLHQSSSLHHSPSPASGLQKKATSRRKSLQISRHGKPYPSLPSGVTKRVANSFARMHSGPTTKLNRETLEAISQASDWFFEQIGEDLASYAEHAGRKTIEEADVVTLMSRQRQTNAATTPFYLAQKYLPRELLQAIRIPQTAPNPKRLAAQNSGRE